MSWYLSLIKRIPCGQKNGVFLNMYSTAVTNWKDKFQSFLVFYISSFTLIRNWLEWTALVNEDIKAAFLCLHLIDNNCVFF